MTPAPEFSSAWNRFRAPETPKAATPKNAQPADAASTGDTAQAPNAPKAPAPAQVQGETPQEIPASRPANAPATDTLGPSFAERCFNALSYAALLVLPLLLLAGFGRLFRVAPWLFPGETGFAESFELIGDAFPLLPSASAPPAWFWFLRLLGKLPYVDGPVLYTAGALLSAILALWATWALAISAGYGRRTAFAAGLILLACPYFPVTAHRIGPEMLFTAILTLASACLCNGWIKERAWPQLACGGLLTGLAALTGGPLGLALPLAASAVFMLGRGKFRRLNRADGVLGFALSLVPVFGWMGAVMILGPADAPLKELLANLIAPFLPPYLPPQNPAWFYLPLLAAALFPWILLPLFALGGTKNTEENRCGGTGWIRLNLLLGLLLLSGMSAKTCLNILPLVPLFALELGRFATRLAPAASRSFFLVISGLFLTAAVALGFVSLAGLWPAGLFPHYAALLAALRGLPAAAGICAVAALALYRPMDRRFSAACLLVCALFISALSYVAVMEISPGCEAFIQAPADISAPEGTP